MNKTDIANKTETARTNLSKKENRIYCVLSLKTTIHCGLTLCMLYKITLFDGILVCQLYKITLFQKVKHASFSSSYIGCSINPLHSIIEHNDVTLLINV